MKFTKMQGAGNDFIIINNMDGQIPKQHYGLLAKALSPRRMAIGADGFMVAAPPEQGGDFKMCFFNADGTTGEMCGNGARCIAKYGYENGLAGEVMNIETTAGMVKAWRLNEMYYKIRLNDVTCMDLALSLSVCGIEYPCAYVELGNPGLPHLVVEMRGLKQMEPKHLFELGNALRHHSDLPKGANVNFYEITGPNQVFERTFERGVEDFTYACGTGTGSVVCVLSEKGLVSDQNVKVSMAGGDLYIDIARENGAIKDVYLSGPAVIVACGEAGREILEEQ